MAEPGRRVLPSARAVVAVVIWGASFVAIRESLGTFGPGALVATRLAVAAAFLYLVLRARGRGPLLPEPGDRARCAFLGAVLGVHSLIQAHGLRFTSSINTGWIISAIPAMIALGSHFVLRQRLRGVGWAGIAVATTGVAAVSLGAAPQFAEARLGDLLQLSSCLTWTVYTLAAPGVVARNGALRVTAFAMLVGAAVAAPPALAEGPLHAPLSLTAVAAMAYLAFLSNGVASLLWYQALHRDGPTRTGAVLYLEPFSTMLAASLWHGEPFTGGTLLGGALVLVGVWLVGRGSRRPAAAPFREVAPAAEAGE